MEDSALHGFARFGFGRRSNEPTPSKARDWVVSQLDAPDPLLALAEPTALHAVLAQRDYEKAVAAGLPPQTGLATVYSEEMDALLQHAATTDLPVRERLIWFWSNHFSVSARAGNWVYGLIGPFIRQAIRPHVTGRFADMLKAVMRDPGMLFYLDNWASDGPHSPLGITQHRGINENLARESLELHTLGVDSGYTQADVTAFAAILTGRSVNMSGDNPGFVFKAEAHEPGPKMFMGHEYAEGFEGSDAALEWIANHPATRRHIATRLVRHFVADEPPPHCVARVETALNQTDGDLKHAMLAVIDMPEAWQPLKKFRLPAEYVVAVHRALDLPYGAGHHMLEASEDLGQPFMGPILPNGWPDTAADWVSGEAILKRADWAMTQASRPGAPTADAVADRTLGDLCSASTRAAIKACPTPAEALATLFASPEFLRR